MKKAIFLSIIFAGTITSIILSWCNKININQEQQPSTSSIILTVIDWSKSYKITDTEKFWCDDKTIKIQLKNKQNIKNILETMIKYHDFKQEDWIYNVFETSENIKINNIYLDERWTAIVNLSWQLRSAWTCDEPRFSEQITETIKSNNYADKTEIYINWENIKYYLSEQDESDLFNNMNRDNTGNIIKNIDQIVAHINNKLWYYEKFEKEIIWESSEWWNSIYYEDSYTYPAIYRKIITKYYGEIWKSIYNLYFDIKWWLIYISQDEYDYNMPMYMEWFDDNLTIIQKNKYYFYKNKLIKRELTDPEWIQKIKNDSDKFKEKQWYLIKYSQEISE